LHANEVAILPYYVANLNIEASYAALTGEYEEYPNLCFVDTLDNIAGLRQRGSQGDFLGALSDENVARIKRQNSRKISVIIGNPPYNANQLNENENNKNRTYPAIDKRIKETYIAASAAQKTKLYDMYARFFRWASDRIDANGIVALVTNRSFVENRTFDGFRSVVAQEFNEINVIDLGGDVRDDPRLSGTKNNVFGIQTGVAISFLLKRSGARGCRIRYLRRPQLETAEEKLSFLANSRISALQFEEITPNKRHDWLNIPVNDFLTFLPVADRDTKAISIVSQERAIFKIYSLGTSTNRDEWLYDHDRQNLLQKINWLITEYDKIPSTSKAFPETLKWSRNLKRRLAGKRREKYNAEQVVEALYRPYCKRWLYESALFIDESGSAAHCSQEKTAIAPSVLCLEIVRSSQLSRARVSRI
jgi:predicted helicase